MIQDNGTSIEYTASASQTIFPYPFEIFEASDLQVYQNNVLLAYSTNYTVTGVGVESGGNVILNVGATAGDTILINREVPYDRTSDYQNGNTLNADSLDKDFDRIIAMIQQIVNQNTYLTPHYAVDSGAQSPNDTNLPVLAENQFWMKGPGNKITATSITPDPGASALQSALASSNVTQGAALVNTVYNITMQAIVQGLGTINTVASDYQILATDFSKILNVDVSSGNKTILLPSVAVLANGWRVRIRASNPGGGTGNYLSVNAAGVELITDYGTHMLLPANMDAEFMVSGGAWTCLYSGFNDIGSSKNFAYDAEEGEYLLEDGRAISRTTYNILFDRIGTIYGAGDGSTTFNIPNSLDRMKLGSGQGAYTFNFSSVDAGTDTITVAANIVGDSLFTGTAFTVSSTGTLPAPLVAATTYYAIEVTGTTFKVATTRANAVAGIAIDLTTAGTGTITASITLASRTIGFSGGEESHTVTINQIPIHNHAMSGLFVIDQPGLVGGGGSVLGSAPTTNNTGGSESHNIMNPYIVMKPMIKVI